MVAIGGNISASILTCSVLMSMEIPVIWAKAVDDQHGLILEQLGVHHVVYPEKDMGRRVAHLVRGAALDFIEIAPGLCAWSRPRSPSIDPGQPLGETGLRKTHGVTIAAFHHDGAWNNADNTTVLHPDDTILVVGPTTRRRKLRPAALIHSRHDEMLLRAWMS